MRKLYQIIMVVVSLMLVFISSGCQSKQDKTKSEITDFLYRYAKVDAETVYEKATLRVSGMTFKDFNVEVVKPIIVKEVKKEESNGVTLYKVKCRIDYVFHFKGDNGNDGSNYYISYAALTIEKKGFSDPVVLSDFSKEIYLAGINEKMINTVHASHVKKGEELIN